jgi:mannose-6-phosphate isomerase
MEAWIILGTRVLEGVPPYILFGFRDGVGEEAFRKMVRAQDIAGQAAALNRVEVRPGEVYLVAAGTPHAIGPGVLMVQVQEPSHLVVNTEYTVGEIRRTETQCLMGLDFDLAMRCFDYRAAGGSFVGRHRLAPRILHEDGRGREEVLIGPEDTPCFGAARLTLRGTVPDRDRGRCYTGIVTGGRGRLTGPECALPLQAGTTLFFPAASQHEAYHALEPPLTLIKCFPPPS